MKLPLITILAITSAHGASLLTLSNPVADGTIDTTGGLNIRTDWDGLAAYPADGNDALTPDFQTITIAHDSTNLYIRQVMNSSTGGFFSGEQLIFMDTDQSWASGYHGGNGTFAVGAEYMLMGNVLMKYTGTGVDWSWDPTSYSIGYDDFPTNDHEMGFSLGLIGAPQAFDFVAMTDFWGGGDPYPNGGNGGETGSYYTYTTVPEPAAALLGGIGVLFLLNRRTKSSSLA